MNVGKERDTHRAFNMEPLFIHIHFTGGSFDF